MNQETICRLMNEDQRAISLSWENFNLGMQEFLVAVRFSEWDRAEGKRSEIIAHAEAALDGLSRLYRRQEFLDR